MKALALALPLAIASTGFAGLLGGSVYSDATGDLFDNGLTNLDIVSVEMSNDDSFLYISVLLGANLDDTSGGQGWGKYAVGINNMQGGPEVNGNAWGRNIDWMRGITHWSATWADDGGSGVGGEVYHWDGSAWVLDGATYAGSTNIFGDYTGHADGYQRWAISLATLGVGVGDTIQFDVISTGGGGGDPGVDHLSRFDPATPGWGTQSVAGSFLSYTVVPAPGAVALLGLAGLAGRRRRD